MPRKEYVPILGDDAVDAIQAKQKARERDAERKRNERKAKKEAKSKAKLEKELRQQGKVPFVSTRDWWTQNRATLTEAQRQELAARQEATLDTLYWAEAWIKGTYDVSPDDDECYVGLELGAEMLQEDVAKFGKVNYYSTTAMFAQELRTDPDFVQIVRSYSHAYPNWTINATEISLRYGYLVGIPAEIADHPLMQHLTRSLRCDECGWEDPATPQVTREFFCPDCIEKRAARTAADFARVNAWVLERHLNKSTPVHLDSWGRK